MNDNRYGLTWPHAPLFCSQCSVSTNVRDYCANQEEQWQQLSDETQELASRLDAAQQLVDSLGLDAKGNQRGMMG